MRGKQAGHSAGGSLKLPTVPKNLFCKGLAAYHVLFAGRRMKCT